MEQFTWLAVVEDQVFFLFILNPGTLHDSSLPVPNVIILHVVI